MVVHLEDTGCDKCISDNMIFMCDSCEVKWAGCWHTNFCWFCEQPGHRSYSIKKRS